MGLLHRVSRMHTFSIPTPSAPPPLVPLLTSFKAFLFPQSERRNVM